MQCGPDLEVVVEPLVNDLAVVIESPDFYAAAVAASVGSTAPLVDDGVVGRSDKALFEPEVACFERRAGLRPRIVDGVDADRLLPRAAAAGTFIIDLNLVASIELPRSRRQD